jgi:hypothetical protein
VRPWRPRAASALGREQWLAEEVLRRAGIDVFVLRVMALFHENLPLLRARSLADDDVIHNAFGAVLDQRQGRRGAGRPRPDAVRAVRRSARQDPRHGTADPQRNRRHAGRRRERRHGVAHPNVAAAVLRHETSTASDPSRYTQLTGRQPVALSRYLGSIEDTLVNGRP